MSQPQQHKGGYKQINKALNICAFEDYLSAQLKHLPHLEDVEQLSPRVIRVLGQNAGKFTLQGTNTYIVGTGSQRLIIDTAQGIPEWADIIESTLDDHSVSLSHVLLSHWHGDHTGGVPDLLRLYPDLSEAIYKNSPGSDQQPIDDGQIFRVEGATIRAVHAPGHSHDHMCFILEEENAMFTGDNVLGHGTSAVEELGLYMEMLRTLQSHNCAVGYPAHGDVIPNLPAKIAGELAQKTRRERQVLVTLDRLKKEMRRTGQGKRASVTVKELVVLIHGEGIDEEVRKMALEPFIDEVLRKLAEDGKVAFEMRGGVKRWFGVGAL
ncbi:Putative Hydroxyacylglutathione hydrolase [Aspergillus calidoustus]|uniref:Putative Hydroxyacylglutathione hydrolase n=1 Tax=Aspergillus calidoustus TaxID=454130 RepID=A0A0U5C564_ASPCI|nr:Putative Hydroxyacylglutathione hydrolase [Aspergillus calidoustus]